MFTNIKSNRFLPSKKIFGSIANIPKNRESNYYTDKDKVVSITYEEIGLFPRSFSRVLDRFLKQLFSDVDNLVIQEYRFYRYLFLTTIKTIFILFFVPFLVNVAAKNYIVKPITEYFWNTNHPEIFLNSYEQKHAFAELENFEEKMYFETLVESHSLFFGHGSKLTKNNFLLTDTVEGNFVHSPVFTPLNRPVDNLITETINQKNLLGFSIAFSHKLQGVPKEPLMFETGQHEQEGIKTQNDFIHIYQLHLGKEMHKVHQEKIIELATYYNNQSIEAITNFFADLLCLFVLLYLLIRLEIQINITKSFLLEVFFGLDDSKKSLLILLITDLLVGYHSSNLWELFFEFIFNHYGIPESQTGIFLLVATLPVLLDVLFKYLIFRHLNRSSPATVATYQAIIE
uniref:Potassium/proton antiporter CemA n=1 Tax=Astrephomene gubernaculifera TaxID=47775 RepID=A0A7R6ULL0_9CHLO|nr:envelope membrane protein [Astrephomene gubernaculifera]